MAYGCLGILTLAPFLFHLSFYFRSAEHNGFIYDGTLPKYMTSPIGSKIVTLSWIFSLISLIFGFYPIICAGYSFLLCHIYFIRLRWTSLHRGFGATGFLMNWLGMAVWLMEVVSLSGISYSTQQLSMCFLRVDFALIILSSGVCKLLSGYFQGEGIEYALVNPMWSSLSNVYMRLNPKNKLLTFLNHNTWFWEVIAGALMLHPKTMAVGSVIIVLSFLFVATHFRLNFLPGFIFVCCCFYFSNSISFPNNAHSLNLTNLTNVTFDLPFMFDRLTYIFILFCFIAMLLTHVCIWINFLNKNTFESRIVKIFNVYANYVGIVIWRVFTADISNFIVQVYVITEGGDKKLISNYGRTPNILGGRYSNTIESVTLACIFNTLKYQPSDIEVFYMKMRMYANSIPYSIGAKIIFEVEKIRKIQKFHMVKEAEFIFDKKTKHIESIIYNKHWAQPSNHSLTKPTLKLGSYGSSL